MSLSPDSGSGAVVSACGRYRYRLWRRWAHGASVAFVMLNPSTADASADDPTIRRCIAFARAWGCGGLVAVNLFAWRATDPRDLARVADPIGPDNDQHMLAVAQEAALVVCAWGVRGELRGREVEVLAKLRAAGITPHYLRLSTGGSPTHPLYLPGNLVPVRWLSSGPGFHYRHPIDECNILVEKSAECNGPMEPVFSEGGGLIGYRCRRCNTTADRAGRTEYGPWPRERTGC